MNMVYEANVSRRSAVEEYCAFGYRESSSSLEAFLSQTSDQTTDRNRLKSTKASMSALAHGRIF